MVASWGGTHREYQKRPGLHNSLLNFAARGRESNRNILNNICIE